MADGNRSAGRLIILHLLRRSLSHDHFPPTGDSSARALPARSRRALLTLFVQDGQAMAGYLRRNYEGGIARTTCSSTRLRSLES